MQRVIMMTATMMAATMMAATAAMAQPSAFDAYLWQRSASPSVQRAVTAFGQHSRGRLHVVAVDDAFEQRHVSLLRVLRSTATPVVLTLRFRTLPADASRVLATLQWWVQQGVTVDAIEIDHDCPTSGLSAYAGWLSSVRAALLTGHAGVGLEITALPTWLDHPDHLALFAVATEVTLQVHAIAAPALLDVDAARRAIARATLERPNVRVALPSYAVTLKGGQPLHARPADVAAVRLAANGVSWFRLPTDDDDTAWDWSTLLAVDSAPGVIADTDAVTVSAVDDGDGAVRIVVDNGLALAAPLPAVRVMGAESMDAIIPGRLAGTTLSSLQARFLLPHGRAVLGWARPSSAAGAFHVMRVDDALPFPAAVLPAGGGLNLPAGH